MQILKKIKGRDPKNKKFQGNCCSCNNWQLPREHRSVNNLWRLPREHRSMNNLFFDKTDCFGDIILLGFFKIFGFQNERFMNFSH